MAQKLTELVSIKYNHQELACISRSSITSKLEP
jgi:hypothetical protein